jgi:hypothetical protein
MENKDMPAYPQPITGSTIDGLTEVGDYNACAVGLSKREMIAAMAMQGFLSGFHLLDDHSAKAIVADSVLFADALLLELSKPQP